MVIATSLQATPAPIVTTAAAADTAATATTAVSPHAWITAMPQAGSAHSATVDSAGIQRDESLATQGPARDSPGRSSSTGELATSSGSQTIPTPSTQGSQVVFLNDLDDEPMWPASDHAGPVTAESHDTVAEVDGATSEADLDLFGILSSLSGWLHGAHQFCSDGRKRCVRLYVMFFEEKRSSSHKDPQMQDAATELPGYACLSSIIGADR